MNKKTTTLLLYSLTLLAVSTSIFFLAPQKNTETATPLEDNLFSEKTIAHGHGLAVDTQDPTKLYIATHHGLLLLQNDVDLYRVGKSKDDYMGFSSHPTETGVFFSSGHPEKGGNIGFQESRDGGTTWKKVSNGVDGPVDFHAMTISSVNPNIIYGWFRGNLQRSINQGKTWSIVNRDLLAISLVADTKDDNTVYAATPKGQGVMVSRDKGTLWKSLSPKLEGGAVSAIAVHPTDAQILLTFSEKLGGMGKSIDGGTTWEKINATWNNETVLHIAFSQSMPNIVYALTHQNKLYKSTDTGDTWKQVR